MRRYVITGGTGFLGRHLIDALLAKDQPPTTIVSFDLREYVHHGSETPDNIEVHTGTVARLGDLVKAFQDASVVFHCVSANALDNRNESLMWSVNVDGTKNIIEACKQCKVEKLVYVSSASVVFDGTHMLNIDETRPYPSRYIDYYSQSKAEAERLVLAANRSSLLTCALRPSSIFGERDPVYVPRLIEAGRQGKTKYIIGNGKTKWEFTYVGNIAHACIQASDALAAGSPVAGNAYFITNNETTIIWQHMGCILGALGYPVPSVSIPYIVCYVIAAIVDFAMLLLSPIYKPPKPPTFTKERVQLLTTHRSLSVAKAQRDFGYKPLVSMEEGTRRTIEYFKSEAAWIDSKKG